MNQPIDDPLKLLEFIKGIGLTVIGDIVFEKRYEAGSVDHQINTGPAQRATTPKPERPKSEHIDKPPKLTETMTFNRKGNVLEGHLTLLYNKLAKEGWIEGDEASFKALFSGKNVMMDDIAEKEQYEKLRSLDYILSDDKYDKLSNHQKS